MQRDLQFLSNCFYKIIQVVVFQKNMKVFKISLRRQSTRVKVVLGFHYKIEKCDRYSEEKNTNELQIVMFVSALSSIT